MSDEVERLRTHMPDIGAWQQVQGFEGMWCGQSTVIEGLTFYALAGANGASVGCYYTEADLEEMGGDLIAVYAQLSAKLAEVQGNG
jgi:hypothetical protein